MDAHTIDDGSTVYVTTEEAERGSKGLFYVVYKNKEQDKRWGFRCSNCETLNNAMDTMGRLVCNECGNTKKADEWDAAHE
ncbi:MAG: DUF5816 domain-containing protein [Halobacteriales archaeon]